MKKNILLKSSIAIIAFLFISIFLFNLKGYFYTCFPATDFSIYQEAIYKIANFESFNPYLNVRDINIFNDHFDPIIFLAVPFVWIFNFHPSSLLVFQILWFLAVFVLIYFKKKNFRDIVFCSGLLIFSRGILGGLVFPLHPVTWSCFPLFLLVYFLSKKNEKGVVLTSLGLLFFKEIYGFSILFLSVYYFINKRKRTAFTLLVFSFLYLLFLFVFREKLLGPVFPYSQRILGPLIANPADFFTSLIRRFNYKELFELHYAFIIPYILIFKKSKYVKNFKESYVFASLLFLLPILGIHVLSDMLINWNGVPFASILLSIFIFSDIPAQLRDNLRLKLLIICIFIASGIRHHSKVFKLLYFEKSKTCEISQIKKEKINEFRSILKTINNDEKMYLSTGLIPWSFDVDKDIYLFGTYSKMMKDMNYLAFERNNTGFSTPYNKEKIETFISSCPGSDILLDNRYIYFVKGPFSLACYDSLFSDWHNN